MTLDIKFRSSDYKKCDYILENIDDIQKLDPVNCIVIKSVKYGKLYCQLLWSPYDKKCSYCKKVYEAGTICFFTCYKSDNVNTVKHPSICYFCIKQLHINKQIDDILEKYKLLSNINLQSCLDEQLVPEIMLHISHLMVQNDT